MSIKGTVRLDKRTKKLAKRLNQGEIAVIDHLDLDEVSAESLLEKKVSAVINASSFNSGRYPNTGPLILCAAGVMLIDKVGPAIFDRIVENDELVIDNGKIMKEGRLVARGDVLTIKRIQKVMDTARTSIGAEIEKFAVNTLDYVTRETKILLGVLDIPPLECDFKDRHALVVVRGYDYKADLSALRSYIRDMKPVLIGVDGGADALIEERFHPDMIVGDMDSVTDGALKSGAELVCHAYIDGNAPGRERLDGLDLEYKTIELEGTSEDLALLIPYQLGAKLIVAVGTHAHLIEFLDKGRQGMASTFLTRLKVGDRLIDAKGVNQLYKGSPKLSHLIVLIAAALSTLSVVILKTPLIRLYLSSLLLKLKLVAGI